MNLKTICLVILCSFSSHIYSVEKNEIFIDVKSSGTSPIKYFQAFGERCSGTNFVERLVEKNFDLKHIEKFGHKHFPAWVDMLPKESSWLSPARYQYFLDDEVEEFLFIVIFRNPLDWIRSFHKKPHYRAKDEPIGHFSHFIRSSWKAVDKNGAGVELPLFDKNPDTLENFENPIILRNYKIQAMLNIKKYVFNICYVNYEKVKNDPKGFVAALSEKFNLLQNEQFANISAYKGHDEFAFKESVYSPISDFDREFIFSQLDWNQESLIGYDREEVTDQALTELVNKRGPRILEVREKVISRKALSSLPGEN